MPATIMKRESSKLLVVDGEEQVRRLLHTVLVRAGYRVHSARTAEEAIQIWGPGPSTNFDAVVCETQLPGMDGHQFAREIARRSPESRIIFVCTFGAHCEECPRALRCRFIPKPFDPKEVVRAVAEAIQDRLQPPA